MPELYGEQSTQYLKSRIEKILQESGHKDESDKKAEDIINRSRANLQQLIDLEKIALKLADLTLKDEHQKLLARIGIRDPTLEELDASYLLALLRTYEDIGIDPSDIIDVEEIKEERRKIDAYDRDLKKFRELSQSLVLKI